MPTIYHWQGSEDTDANEGDNWLEPIGGTTGTVPVSGDSIVFNAESDGNNNCAFPTTFPASGNLLHIDITTAFTKLITSSGSGATTVNLNGYMNLSKAACLDASSSSTLTFDFNGAPGIRVFLGDGTEYTHRAYIKYDTAMSSSPFFDADARANTTFNFGSNNFTMPDGIYPNMVFTGTLYAKKVYSDSSQTEFNTYGSVDMLNFSGGEVNSSAFDIYDYDKQFYFEKDLTGIGENFKFGHTTARFKTYRSSGTGSVIFPVTGELNSAAFGNDTTNNFYTQYHKVVIENNDSSSNYWLVNAGKFLECNEIVIRDGGRFYGPSSGTKAVCIRSVKRPTVQGDWNFRQITDGIYESIGDSTNIPVSHGGTGLQTIAKGSILYGNGNGSIGVLPIGSNGQTLKVSSSGIPEWVS